MELRQLFRTLRRRWKFTVTVLLLGIIGAGVVTSSITPTYKSEARVYITATSTGTLDAYNVGIYSATRIASYADLAKDPAVLQRVIKRVGVDMLNRLQPGRKAEDVFPTRYAMNTRRDLQRLFAPHAVHVYGHTSEPQYFGRSAVAWRVAATLDHLTPPRLAPTLMIFVQKAEPR